MSESGKPATAASTSPATPDPEDCRVWINDGSAHCSTHRQTWHAKTPKPSAPCFADVLPSTLGISLGMSSDDAAELDAAPTAPTPDRGTGYMTTFTGKQFNHASPSPESVCIEDIAHHLSMLCHWGGASREFVSVAQHSVLVSNLCPPELRLWALLHDAAEAYYSDVIRPLKVLLPEYKQYELRGMKVIAEKFGLSWPEPPALKEFDNRALLIESREFMHASEAVHDGRGNLVRFDDLESLRLTAQSPANAEASFLARFAALSADVGLSAFVDELKSSAPTAPTPANCKHCGHPETEHVAGHGCTHRMEGDGSECTCGFVLGAHVNSHAPLGSSLPETETPLDEKRLQHLIVASSTWLITKDWAVEDIQMLRALASRLPGLLQAEKRRDSALQDRRRVADLEAQLSRAESDREALQKQWDDGFLSRVTWGHVAHLLTGGEDGTPIDLDATEKAALSFASLRAQLEAATRHAAEQHTLIFDLHERQRNARADLIKGVEATDIDWYDDLQVAANCCDHVDRLEPNNAFGSLAKRLRELSKAPAVLRLLRGDLEPRVDHLEDQERPEHA